MNNVSVSNLPVFYVDKKITFKMEKVMNFDKINTLLDKVGVDGDEIKNNFKDAVEKEIKEGSINWNFIQKDLIENSLAYTQKMNKEEKINDVH